MCCCIHESATNERRIDCGRVRIMRGSERRARPNETCTGATEAQSDGHRHRGEPLRYGATRPGRRPTSASACWKPNSSHCANCATTRHASLPRCAATPRRRTPPPRRCTLTSCPRRDSTSCSGSCVRRTARVEARHQGRHGCCGRPRASRRGAASHCQTDCGNHRCESNYC
jgi:hypothetical protein